MEGHKLKIAIVTDSVGDVPGAVARELNITVVPLSVIFGEESFLDGVDIDSASFYEKLKTSSVMPSTSQPTPAAFMDVYRELLNTYDYIFSIHASSELSGTYQSAVLARDEVAPEKIEVVDSRAATACQALIVIEAARRAAGPDADIVAVRQRIQEVMASTRLLFVVGTLEYLHKNGRIGKAASVLGTLLSIKPLLTIEDGVVAPYEKVLGSRKALKRVMQLVEEEVGQAPISVMVAHCAAPDKASEFVEAVKANLNCVEIRVIEVGPVVGAHAGPGAAGIGWHTVPEKA